MEILVIIAYDIQKDRKRSKVSKLLEDCGARKNYSVFECFVTHKKLEEIQATIGKIINKKTDSVLYYPICRACAGKMFFQGTLSSEMPCTVVV
jgi:CRISPR-associated protein Cas2